MAALRPGPHSRWSLGRPLPRHVECAQPVFRGSDRQPDNARRLPPIRQTTARGRQGPQHDCDGAVIATRLPALQVRCERALDLATACVQAARPLSDKRAGERIAGRDRHAAHSPVHHLGGCNRRAGKCDTGPDVEPRGLRQWPDRLYASRARDNEQAPDRSADERAGASCARGSVQRAAVGSCHRVWRQAGGQREEGFAAVEREDRHKGIATRSEAQRGCVDGAGGRSHVTDRAILGAYQNGCDRTLLRQVLTCAHEGCERCHGVLKAPRYTWGQLVHRLKTAEKLVPLNGLEPLTPSLRRAGTHAKLRFLRRITQAFSQYRPVLFAFRFGLRYTGTIDPAKRANAHTGSDHNRKGVRHG